MIKVKWDSIKNATSSFNVTTRTSSERPTLTALMDALSSIVRVVAIATWPHRDVHHYQNGTWAQFQKTQCPRNHQRISKLEIREHGEEVLRGLIDHVHTRMLQELCFLEQAIPPLEFERNSMALGFDPGASNAGSRVGSVGSVRSSSSSICSTNDGFRMMIDTTEPRCNFTRARTQCLSCGILEPQCATKRRRQVGSMLPYFQKAIEAGYGILVMNPNMNTQLMVTQDGTVEKMPFEAQVTLRTL
ncbi:hypothetical protein Plhal703r1_c03g0013881 [Plasmopara halstedii]